MQDIIVWIIIAGAAVYLFRHFQQSFSVKKGCQGCKKCSMQEMK